LILTVEFQLVKAIILDINNLYPGMAISKSFWLLIMNSWYQQLHFH